MKSLKDFIEECTVSPANTTGLGNPSVPNVDELGSGDQIRFRSGSVKIKNRRSRKRVRDKQETDLMNLDKNGV